MFVVHEARRPSKIMQDRYLAKLMARRRTSFAMCYITFKTRIRFKEHMKKGAQLLTPGPASVKGGFVREFIYISKKIFKVHVNLPCVSQISTG